MKNIIEKISLILFSLIMMFTSVNIVLGDAYSDANSGTTISGNKSDKPNRIPHINNKNTYAGFRISFVTNTGVPISSFDYYANKIDNYSNINIASQKYSKVSYLKGYYNGASNITWKSVKNNNIGYKSFSDFKNMLNKYNFSVDLSGIKHAGSIQLEEMVNMLFKKSSYSGNSNNYSEDLKKLLSEQFSIDESYLTESQIHRVFAVIEPTFVILMYNKPYYGTAYEVSTLASLAKWCKKTDKGFDCTTSTAWTNNYDMYLSYNAPCSSYLDGSLYDRINSKLGYSLDGFNVQDIYFGNININFSKANKICSSAYNSKEKPNYFTAFEATGRNGIGMGVIWLYEEMTTDKLKNTTCAIVKNKVKVPNNLLCDDNSTIDDIVSVYNSWANKNKYTTISNEWYKKNCGCENPSTENYNCTPKYNIGACILNSDQRSYNTKYSDRGDHDLDDDDYWKKCVFDDIGYYQDGVDHKYSSDSYAWTYRESSLGDQNYCEVYCVEDLITYFPKSPQSSFKSGTYIPVNSWSYDPAYHSKIIGSRTCKTKSVNWDQFKNDLDTSNKNIANAYYNWKLEEAKNNATIRTNDPWNEKTNPNGLQCGEPIYETTYNGWSDWKHLYTYNSMEECQTILDNLDNNEASQFECFDSGGQGVLKYKERNKSTTLVAYSGNSYTYTIGKVSVNSSLYNQRKGITYQTECYDTGLSSNSKVNAAEEAYNEALDTYQGFIDKMKKCYEWEEDSIYNINTNASIVYKSFNNEYILNSSLDSEISYNISDGSDIINDEVTFHRYNCSGNNCGDGTTYLVKQYKTVTKTRNGSQIFTVDDKQIYNYVLKNSSLSVIERPIENYIYIGPHFPIPHKTLSGIQLGLNINYSGLGHTGGNGSSIINSIFSVNEKTKDFYGKWECLYNVTSKLICDPSNENCDPNTQNPTDPENPTNPEIPDNPDVPEIPDEPENPENPTDPENPTNPKPNKPSKTPDAGGLKVVWRKIDLNNPFPDINGKGRNTGSNWCGKDGCSSNNELVKSVITDKQYIYHEKPMYTFILNPEIIKQIRDYNKTTSYTDYNLKCEVGTGNACISEFVSGLIEGSLNGRTFDATNQSTKCDRNPNSNFYKCQPKAKS